MGILETAIFYLFIGVAVAFASLLIEREARPVKRGLLFVGTLIFWPLFAPFLLSRRAAPPESGPDPLARRIASTEAELIAALGRVRFAGEADRDRVRKLAVALSAMAKRLSEMDRLLETPEFSATRAEALLAELEAKVKDREDTRLSSVRARLRNIERVRAMRSKTGDDLERALFRMEEMSSQMIVLELAGGGEAEVMESIRDLAIGVDAAVEGHGFSLSV